MAIVKMCFSSPDWVFAIVDVIDYTLMIAIFLLGLYIGRYYRIKKAGK